MNWLKKLLGEAPPPRTMLDNVQELSRTAIITRFRTLARERNCAPSASMTDDKIIDIYKDVITTFQNAARSGGERIPAGIINCIAFKFIQVFETMGKEMYVSHLEYETKRYLSAGLRPEYEQNPIQLL